MGYTLLLDKTNAPLRDLTVGRLQLDAACPSVTMTTDGQESLLYLLVGRANVYANGYLLGTLGGRQSVIEPLCHVVRFPARRGFTVTLGLQAFAADMLWVSCATAVATTGLASPYLHMTDVAFHSVGTGTHHRTVAEVPRPEGYLLDTGETLNSPGGWSSYPSHANQRDLERFRTKNTTWEEAMWFCCPLPGIIDYDGQYADGRTVNTAKRVYNGEALVMPLGQHHIVAHPSTWMWYWWGYCGTALEKQYRKYSTDVGTYRK